MFPSGSSQFPGRHEYGVQLSLRMQTSHFRVVLERIVVECADCGTSETWLEQCFRATEAFADNSEDVSVGAQTCREDNGDTNTATQDTVALLRVQSVRLGK